MEKYNPKRKEFLDKIDEIIYKNKVLIDNINVFLKNVKNELLVSEAEFIIFDYIKRQKHL